LSRKDIYACGCGSMRGVKCCEVFVYRQNLPLETITLMKR
ncbi:hypothetical protein C6341_g13118, partial [Phytophthora cactorum]